MNISSFSLLLTFVLFGCSANQQVSRHEIQLDQGQSLPIILTDNSVIDTTLFKTVDEFLLESETSEWIIDDPQPVPTHEVAPKFPVDIQNLKDRSTVWVKALVDSNGNVVKAIIVKTDDTRFNKSALRAMIQWKFLSTSSTHGVVIPFRFQKGE